MRFARGLPRWWSSRRRDRTRGYSTVGQGASGANAAVATAWGDPVRLGRALSRGFAPTSCRDLNSPRIEEVSGVTAASQSFCSIQLAELAIECAQGDVSSFSRNLENHAVRETNLGPFSVVRECGLHHVWILKHKPLVIE